MELDKVIKLLNLTKSDNDNEALSAIRSANKLLEANHLKWATVIKSTAAKSEQKFDPPVAKEDRTKTQMYAKFEVLLKNVDGGTWDFIDSLRNGYLKYGRLTPKQKACFEKCYEEHLGDYCPPVTDPPPTQTSEPPEHNYADDDCPF